MKIANIPQLLTGSSEQLKDILEMFQEDYFETLQNISSKQKHIMASDLLKIINNQDQVAIQKHLPSYNNLENLKIDFKTSYPEATKLLAYIDLTPTIKSSTGKLADVNSIIFPKDEWHSKMLFSLKTILAINTDNVTKTLAGVNASSSEYMFRDLSEKKENVEFFIKMVHLLLDQKSSTSQMNAVFEASCEKNLVYKCTDEVISSIFTHLMQKKVTRVRQYNSGNPYKKMFLRTIDYIDEHFEKSEA